MPFQAQTKIIYVDRPLTPEEKASTEPRYIQGSLPVTDMTNHEIEAEIIYVDRPLTPEEIVSTEPRYIQGFPLPVTDMTNHEIEADNVRRRLKSNEGNLCIGIQPGDELGELYVNIQFEGPKDTGHGEPDVCMQGQNELLIHASEWLEEILGEFSTDWEVTIEAKPCPKATQPLRIEHAAAILEQRNVETVVSETVPVPQPVIVEHEIRPA